MQEELERWDVSITLLQSIQNELQRLNDVAHDKLGQPLVHELVQVPFKGSEIYLLIKSFLDAGGAPNENYKSMLEKTVPFMANKTQRGFSAQSFCKYSDKVDPEAKDTVKRFLQRMMRNIDSYD